MVGVKSQQKESLEDNGKIGAFLQNRESIIYVDIVLKNYGLSPPAVSAFGLSPRRAFFLFSGFLPLGNTNVSPFYYSCLKNISLYKQPLKHPSYLHTFFLSVSDNYNFYAYKKTNRNALTMSVFQKTSLRNRVPPVKKPRLLCDRPGCGLILSRISTAHIA